MKPRKVELFKGSAHVEVVPSHEGGIFIGRFGNVVNVGKVAIIAGMSLEDALNPPKTLSTSLGRYVVADEDNPGTYRFMRGSHGTIIVDESHRAGITDGIIQEFTPYIPEQKAIVGTGIQQASIETRTLRNETIEAERLGFAGPLTTFDE